MLRYLRAVALLTVLLITGASRAEEPASQPASAAAPEDELEALRRAAAAETETEAPPEAAVQAASELDSLQQAALRESSASPQPDPLTSVVNAAVGNLNRLNPEISVSADAAGLLVPHPPGVIDEARSGFLLRHLELDLQASMDPFTSFRAQIAAGAHGFEIEEVTLRWTGPLDGMSLTAGRFKQALGTLNRWHMHAWDQYDLPLALRGTVGEHGLLQTGLRAEWLLPWLAVLPTTLTLELTNSENSALLAGEMFALPSALGRVASELPLGGFGYLELGGSWLHGYHHQIIATGHGHDHEEDAHAEEEGEEAHLDAVPEIVVEEARATDLGSLDLNLAYDPAGGADRFRVYLRAQLLYLRRDEAELGVQQQLGGFAYLNAHLGRSWELGLRGDALSGRHAELEHALEHTRIGIAPYLSWWQSEFVRARLQYRVEADAAGFDHPEHLVLLQLTGAVGPHRHERY